MKGTTVWLNEVHIGNVLDVLRQMPSEMVDCVVTSPPYYGLRDYDTDPIIFGGDKNCDHDWEEGIRPGMSGGLGYMQDKNKGSWHDPHPYWICKKCEAFKGSLGLEPHPQMYVEHLVEIFSEIKRVLKPTGTFWLNLGDSYAGSGGASDYRPDGASLSKSSKKHGFRTGVLLPTGFKAKDLMGIPWRAAFALQADGWWLRSDVIWCKPNPMPESVDDRPTKAHEYIFLFAKSKEYFFDREAVKEKSNYEVGKALPPIGGPKYTESGAAKDTYSGNTPPATGYHNIRSFWTITTHGYFGAHFATFPEKLVENCIKAGSSEKGCCPKCGAPWERIIDKIFTDHDGTTKSLYPEGTNAKNLAKLRQAARDEGGEYGIGRLIERPGFEFEEEEYVNYETKTLRWQSTCTCGEKSVVPAVVLDPFTGSGTTAEVSKRFGRDWIAIELNQKYEPLIRQRVKEVRTGFFTNE